MSIACAQPTQNQRIVLITLDTLRYDSVAATPALNTAQPADTAQSANTAQPSTMPRLARWAEQAARFERFYSATAATQPSHASMFTGLHPWQHGVTGNRLRLADHHLTVAERLKDAGYATAAVVASLPVSQRFGFAQGFDRYDDEFVLTTAIPGSAAPGADQQVEPFYTLAEVITDRALAQIAATTSARQFFWFHYFDPHSPYGDTADGASIEPREILARAVAGEATDEAVRQARQLYDIDVGHLDAELDRLLRALSDDEESLETHIVITADHGESFGEDGSLAHGRRLIPSQLHVPCLIRSPRLAPGPREDVAGSIDIAATLLAFAGLEAMPQLAEPFASRDLAVVQPRTLAFGMRRTWGKPHRDIRLDGSVHLLEGHLFFMVDEAGRLVRGNRDRLETVAGPDRPSSDAEAERIRALFDGFERTLSPAGTEVEIDPDVDRALRALGYTG
ncbi:MAG: sulfatase [Acidobacteriota bacterium]